MFSLGIDPCPLGSIPVSLLWKQVTPSLSEDEIDLQGNIGERIFMGRADGCCSISISPALIVNITSIEET